MQQLNQQPENLDYSKLNEYIHRKNSEFLANLSFEIRSPLNDIVGLVYLLKDTTLDQEQHKYLSQVNKSSTELVELISNVLDLSRIDAKYITIEPARFSILEDVASYVESFSLLKVSQTKIKFNIITDSNLAQPIVGDKQKLIQILQNLISNAFKFTDNGSITVEFHRIAETNRHITLQIVVTDTGIGIPESFLPKLYVPFARVDKTTTRKFHGAGLGLTVCHRLIQFLGGEISVKSVVGMGSTFTVTIPFEKDSVNQAMADSTQKENIDNTLSKKQVLVVDDAELNQMISRKILEKLGAIVTIASSGLEAVNLVAKQNFDIVLMDIQMPIMDGYEATRRIRKDTKNSKLPIIAVSAAALDEDRQKSMTAGMNDHIAKPFDPSTIGQLLSKWVS